MRSKTLRQIVFLLFAAGLLTFGPVRDSVFAQEQQPITIPNDLDEAHADLLRRLPKETIEEMKSGTEDDMIKYHFGLGMWMRNNWGLWQGGSSLAAYFNQLGIFHPDDMSGTILDTFWCKLNNQPFRLEERVAGYQTYWRAMKKPEGVSPKDSSKIFWASIQHGKTRIVHLGISLSDRSYWRFEYGGAERIEPATSEEAAQLDELQRMWLTYGKRLEDYAK